MAGRNPVEAGSLSPKDDLLPLVENAAESIEGSLEEVIPLLYEELRRVARRELRREQPGHTLSTTALAHEAYIELSKLHGIRWKSRPLFFSVCARVIRHVLVDYAVSRNAQKRGGGVVALPLEAAEHVGTQRPEAWIELDEALQELARIDERHARVVECRFFGGMSVEETAEALDIAPATVKRDWALARAWLHQRLTP